MERKTMKSQNPIVRTVNRFLLRTTAVCAVFFLLAGTATVRQRAQEINTGKSAPVCSFVDSEDEIGICLPDKKIVMKKQTLEKARTFIRNLMDYLNKE